MIEEDERADHPPLLERQHSPHLEAAEIAAALIDHHFEHRRFPRLY